MTNRSDEFPRIYNRMFFKTYYSPPVRLAMFIGTRGPRGPLNTDRPMEIRAPFTAMHYANQGS